MKASREMLRMGCTERLLAPAGSAGGHAQQHQQRPRRPTRKKKKAHLQHQTYRGMNEGWMFASEMEQGRAPPTGSRPAKEGSSARSLPPAPLPRKRWGEAEMPAEASTPARAKTMPRSGDPLHPLWTQSVVAMGYGALEDLERTLTLVATEFYYNQDFVSARFEWTRVQFVATTRKASARDLALIECNLAATLHHSGKYSEALAAYQHAVSVLEKCRPGPLRSWFEGGMTDKRICFVKHRMRMAQREEKPPIGEYLSHDGTLRLDGKENFERNRQIAEREKQLRQIEFPAALGQRKTVPW
jgi:hypothetical protein